MAERATRANGEASRRRILDAAAAIAGERGYSGTSISDVSARSGLPKSSIYWHFADKDALFAAVIQDSYQRWLEEFLGLVDGRTLTPSEVVVLLHDCLANFPDFLRFGQLVVLERHETELSARAEFLEIRRSSLEQLAVVFGESSGTTPDESRALAAVALALVDGAFLARAAGETTLDDSAILGAAVDAYLTRLRAGRRAR